MLVTDEEVPGNRGGSEDGEQRLISGPENVKRTFDYKNDLQEKEETRIAVATNYIIIDGL